MKKILFVKILILSIVLNVNSQELGTINLSCDYQLSYSKNKNDIQDKGYSIMTLDLSENCSRFCNIDAQKKDSLLYWDLKVLSPTEILGNKSRYRSKDPKYAIFKNYPEKDVLTYCSKIVDQYYQYKEKPIFNWKLTNESDTIIGYHCLKATCNYGGREYIAWFTPDIPVSDGPWKFSGTPGLILSVADTEGHYSFKCVGIKQMKATSVKILFADRDYISCKKKEFQQAENSSKQDLVKYINNTTGISITRASSVNKSKFVYNPIELE